MQLFIVSLLIAAGASYFWLDPKVTKKSRRKKAPPHRPNARPRFSVQATALTG
jgi:hypothetical protein